jgi:hypothetical protein
MQRFLRSLAGVTVLAVAGIAGCSDRPRTYKVQGTVMFENNPMIGGGSISFVPLGNATGKTAGGEIDAEGKYSLMTHKPGDGSMVGEFRVVIYQQTALEGENTREGEVKGGMKGVVPVADRIPVIYADTYNSPLRAKVEARDVNEINFTLERRPAPAALRDLLFGERFALTEPGFRFMPFESFR